MGNAGKEKRRRGSADVDCGMKVQNQYPYWDWGESSFFSTRPDQS